MSRFKYDGPYQKYQRWPAQDFMSVEHHWIKFAMPQSWAKYRINQWFTMYITQKAYNHLFVTMNRAVRWLRAVIWYRGVDWRWVLVLPTQYFNIRKSDNHEMWRNDVISWTALVVVCKSILACWRQQIWEAKLRHMCSTWKAFLWFKMADHFVWRNGRET